MNCDQLMSHLSLSVIATCDIKRESQEQSSVVYTEAVQLLALSGNDDEVIECYQF